MLTRANIAYNLEKTPHKLSINYEGVEVVYHFSSNQYLTKFETRRDDNRNSIEESLFKRFGFAIKLDILADLKLYSSLEKRGFLISVNGEYKWQNTIILDGLKLM